MSGRDAGLTLIIAGELASLEGSYGRLAVTDWESVLERKRGFLGKVIVPWWSGGVSGAMLREGKKEKNRGTGRAGYPAAKIFAESDAITLSPHRQSRHRADPVSNYPDTHQLPSQREQQ